MGSPLFRGTIGDTAPVADREYGGNKAQTVLWDLSLSPSDNADRDKKLGKGDGTHGMAWCKFDSATLRAGPADGINFGNRKSAYRLFEPDNWVLRLHVAEGRGKDGVWALRCISDHNNKHNERKMRSTMVLDQRKSQHWGTLAELLWVKDVNATVAHDELRFNAAGFLRDLCDGGAVATGKEAKYHSCLNVFKQAGYVTDGENIGQFQQIFAFSPFVKNPTLDGPKKFDGDCSPVDADAEDESAGGKQSSRDGDKYGEMMLWSDVAFKQGSTTVEEFVATGGTGAPGNTGTLEKIIRNYEGPLGIDPQPDFCPSGLLVWGGLLWSPRKAGSKADRKFADPTNQDNGKLESELEDSPQLGKKVRKFWIRPWVRVPFT